MTFWQWLRLRFTNSMPETTDYHSGKATSFADPQDIEGYRKWKAKGASDQEAFKHGDNGVGFFGDDTTEGSGPSCALPPEDMVQKWGGLLAAKHKHVEVTVGERKVVCVLKDRMPHKANIKNGAVIDLNPDAWKALGYRPPCSAPCQWKWV